MRQKKVFLILSVLLVAVLFIAISGNVSEAKEKVFKFAHISAFSGSAAAWGKMLDISLDIAVGDINAAGGIKVGGESYKVEKTNYDHAYDPSVTVTVTRKALFQDGMKYVCILGGGVIPSVNDLFQTQKVIAWGAAGGDHWIGTKYPYTWKPYHAEADNLDVILEYALKKHPEYKRIALIYVDDEMGYTLGKQNKKIAEDRGLEVVDVLYLSRDATDFYPMLTTLLPKGVDLMDLSVIPGGQLGVVIKQARELGFKGITIHSDTIDTATIAGIAGIEALEGSLGANQYVNMPTDLGKRWAKQYLAKDKGGLQSWSAYSYDFLWLLKTAIEKANTFDTEKVNAVLETVEFDGALGHVRFGGKQFYGANRLMIMPVNVVEVVNGKVVDAYNGIAQRWK